MLTLCPSAQAQSEQNKQIAVLISNQTTPAKELLSSFQESLNTNGITAKVSYYSLQNNPGKIAAAVETVRKNKPDLIFTLGSAALKVAGENFANLPVVASLIMNKADLGRYPNVTGVCLEFSIKKQLEWLQKLLPEAKNIGVTYNSEGNHAKLKEAQKVLEQNGLRLWSERISEPSRLPLALKQLEKQIDVFWGLSDAMVLNPKTAKNILLFSFRNKIPFVGLSDAWVKAGALYALERDYADIGKQCAEMADKILAGQVVGKIPASHPRQLKYSLNLKVAERMKIDLSAEWINNSAKRF